MKEITTTEEFVKKYGHITVQFCSYYEYTFRFSGDDGLGHRIDCSVGGDFSDIYRFEVSAGEECLISDLEPFSVTVKNKSGRELVNFYDF